MPHVKIYNLSQAKITLSNQHLDCIKSNHYGIIGINLVFYQDDLCPQLHVFER